MQKSFPWGGTTGGFTLKTQLTIKKKKKTYFTQTTHYSEGKIQQKLRKYIYYHFLFIRPSNPLYFWNDSICGRHHLAGSATGELPQHLHVYTHFAAVKMHKSHYYSCWLKQLFLWVLSLPLTSRQKSSNRVKGRQIYSACAVTSLSNTMEILHVREWDWEQLAFPKSHFSFTPIPPQPIICSVPPSPLPPAALALFAAWLFFLFVFPACCLTKPFPSVLSFPLLFFSSSSYSSPSFFLLVSQLQMSNPSTPPQAVSSIVRCEACAKQECVLVCRKS